MEPLDTIISSGVLAAGGSGILVVIGLFIRQLISNTTKNTTKNEAEIDILTMWRVERDALKALTEELQKERVELTIKLTVLQAQLSTVQQQLAQLVEDKKVLQEEVKHRPKECATCAFRP